MAQLQQPDLQNLTAALMALQHVLPNISVALTNNTNAINNLPRRETEMAEIPYFYGRNQNPISQLKGFTKSYNANAFQSQTLVETWTTELERRCQQPEEDVDTYAAALQELYRRVEYGAFSFPEVMKVQKFVNGLLPDLYMNVKPYHDQTWANAVNRAKSYELIHQNQAAIAAHMNKYMPAVSNIQVNILNDAIATLTQQMSQMTLALANQTNPNWRANF